MKSLMALCLLVGLIQSAFSMPCDTGYECVSKTGKYKVSLQRCRYRNNINLISTSINNVEVKEATLNKGWDGDLALAFEINLPTKVDGSVKILSAELSSSHKSGFMKVKYAESEPGPLSVIHTEKISCIVTE
ncbi:MAG: hypothetical protein ACXVLQ_19170 [Bacteriovorax sp.]